MTADNGEGSIFERVRSPVVELVEAGLQTTFQALEDTPMHVSGCEHITAITTVKQPKQRVCEECIKIGSDWVHLRTCQNCGSTLCCDNSPNRHATKHAKSSGHPVIASAEPGERWLFCYPDDEFAEY